MLSTLSTHFTAAVTSARSLAQLDHLARQTWKAYGEGHLSDADAQAISEAVEGRRTALKPSTPLSATNRPSARRRPTTPDKRKSIERRRALASSGAVPGKIACTFTLGEVAALTVIARQIQRMGKCELPIDAIAAMAGTCRTVVQGALRQARELGLVSVKERRWPGRKSETNIIVIISKEWLAWLRLGRVRKNERLVVTENSTGESEGATTGVPGLFHDRIEGGRSVRWSQTR